MLFIYRDKLAEWRKTMTIQQIADLTGVSKQCIHRLLQRYYPEVHSLFVAPNKIAAELGVTQTTVWNYAKGLGTLGPRFTEEEAEKIKSAILSKWQRVCSICGTLFIRKRGSNSGNFYCSPDCRRKGRKRTAWRRFRRQEKLRGDEHQYQDSQGDLWHNSEELESIKE